MSIRGVFDYLIVTDRSIDACGGDDSSESSGEDEGMEEDDPAGEGEEEEAGEAREDKAKPAKAPKQVQRKKDDDEGQWPRLRHHGHHHKLSQALLSRCCWDDTEPGRGYQRC
jgi:hypothetical protein